MSRLYRWRMERRFKPVCYHRKKLEGILTPTHVKLTPNMLNKIKQVSFNAECWGQQFIKKKNKTTQGLFLATNDAI